MAAEGLERERGIKRRLSVDELDEEQENVNGEKRGSERDGEHQKYKY